MSDGGILAMHMHDATAEVLKYMKNLLLLQSFCSISDKQIKEGTICAEFVDDVYLLHTICSSCQLGFVDGDNILVPTQLSLYGK